MTPSEPPYERMDVIHTHEHDVRYEPLSGLDALRHDIEAEPRAEGLRDIVKRTADMGLCSQTHHEYLRTAAMVALHEYDAATPPAEELDVERCPACGGSVWPDGQTRHWPRKAALAPEQPE